MVCCVQFSIKWEGFSHVEKQQFELRRKIVGRCEQMSCLLLSTTKNGGRGITKETSESQRTLTAGVFCMNLNNVLK